MKIVQLEYFCMVSQYHSITQAAQKLYVTQPAISNAIKELEKEFSVNLFVRSKNHLTLTTEGELFYQKARELLASIKQTTQQFYDLGKQIPPYPHRHPAAVKHDFFSGSRPGI
ncbi:MAG: LysR family transcriptional regulator [Lachnospiraceae bacterium]